MSNKRKKGWIKIYYQPETINARFDVEANEFVDVNCIAGDFAFGKRCKKPSVAAWFIFHKTSASISPSNTFKILIEDSAREYVMHVPGGKFHDEIKRDVAFILDFDKAFYGQEEN